jgi:hypothetical protein
MQWIAQKKMMIVTTKLSMCVMWEPSRILRENPIKNEITNMIPRETMQRMDRLSKTRRSEQRLHGSCRLPDEIIITGPSSPSSMTMMGTILAEGTVVGAYGILQNGHGPFHFSAHSEHIALPHRLHWTGDRRLPQSGRSHIFSSKLLLPYHGD